MPKPEKPAKPEPLLHSFYYPTIGNGMTISAPSQEEADKIAEKLRAELR